ncbi:MAG: nitroreductase family deazaflavin-dependent oxidoreductase, partial [Actinobacteria bacterium]|nr:nitroreductase family deazaflavin-dependent oxidoreductase [Actinomycetota bacterium]
MTIEGEYIPGKVGFTRRQVEAYEASGGTAANVVEGRDVGVVIVTMRGAKSGAVRKIALIRVEHEGEYALVASMGGAPTDPQWAGNLRAHPDEVAVQDGPAPHHVVVREVD